VNATERTYLGTDHALEVDATVLAVQDGAFAVDRTCFFPGGGGQPADTGTVSLPDGARLAISGLRVDGERVIWHAVPPALATAQVGQHVHLAVDAARRLVLARYHTVLHVLNTIVLREHGGWITGAQIAADHARCDFKLDRLSPALCADLTVRVEAVLRADLPVSAASMPQAEFDARGDLLRTLEVRPPVVDGQVRIVAIGGFDAQACGGTHVQRTSQVGRFVIERSENKGRQNKRIYVRLEPP
jgi:misacylated tRNA(Ala) deacylase